MPHAWKSGIVKAASLHLNAVLPGDAPPGVLRGRHADQHGLTVQTLPADGRLRGRATAPGLGVDLDPDILERFAVSVGV